MGCGASKDDIAEPRRMQLPHGLDILQRVDTEAAGAKPIDLTSDCICSLYDNNSSAVLNDPSPPLSAFIHTPRSLSTSDEDDDEDDDEEFDLNSFDIPSKLSIVEEGDNDPCLTTALAALSGEETVAEKTEVGDQRQEAIVPAGSIAEQSDECCALGMLTSQSAILQALLSTGPVITQQTLGADLSTRVGHVAVISGPEPIRWEPTLRKAEIIDLDDQEPDGGAGESAMVDNTPELLQDEKPADYLALTEAQPKQDLKLDDALTHSVPEPRKAKLPPLTIVPPILVELPADPFVKPAFPIALKQDFMEVKVPVDTEQFEDLSADRMAQLLQREDPPHDVRSKSSLVTERDDGGTPTLATNSPADSEWRSLQRDSPDPDIENIDLLESPELDSLPLLPMLDCHGIHADKKDLISPTLRLVA